MKKKLVDSFVWRLLRLGLKFLRVLLRGQSVPDRFEEVALRFRDRTMITFLGDGGGKRDVTFGEADELANRVAHFFKNKVGYITYMQNHFIAFFKKKLFLLQGIKKGEVVAVVMENRIEYPRSESKLLFSLILNDQ